MKIKTIKKEDSRSVNNVLAVIAVVVVVAALFNLIITFVKVSEFNKQLTGYATATAVGYINLTVNTALAVDITPAIIYWGPGLINVTGSVNANLTTNGNSSATVQGGNWSNASITGLIIKNIGNINGSLNFTMTKNVTDFFGAASHASKNYSINISQREPGSCNSTALFANTWRAANRSMWRICNNFGADGAANEMWVDVLLTIPYDLNNTGVQITDTYTATLENPITS